MGSAYKFLCLYWNRIWSSWISEIAAILAACYFHISSVAKLVLNYLQPELFHVFQHCEISFGLGPDLIWKKIFRFGLRLDAGKISQYGSCKYAIRTPLLHRSSTVGDFSVTVDNAFPCFFLILLLLRSLSANMRACREKYFVWFCREWTIKFCIAYLIKVQDVLKVFNNIHLLIGLMLMQHEHHRSCWTMK